MTTLLISALFIVSFAGVETVSASPTYVYIDPPLIMDTEMGPDTIFTVDIVVDYVERLWGYQFDLTFNPAVLQGVSVDNGPFLGSAGGTVIVAPGPGFDNEAGTLGLFGAALYPKTKFPTGGGVLATVTFQVIEYGDSHIILGSNTGLADRLGKWLFHGPGGPCYFINVAGAPELYMRTKGAHGVSGIWEEWQVGLYNQEQTLYAKIPNWGDLGAWVKVKFVVKSAVFGVQEYESDTAYAGPAIGDEPGLGEVSASFYPAGPGKYYVMGILYFGVHSETCFLYSLSPFEGIGESKDTNVAYKVTA